MKKRDNFVDQFEHRKIYFCLIRYRKKLLYFLPSAYQLKIADHANNTDYDIQPTDALQLQKLASKHHQKKRIFGYFFLHVDINNFVSI